MLATARTLTQTAERAGSQTTAVRIGDWTESKSQDSVTRECRLEISDFWSRYTLRYSQTTDADGTKHRTQWHFGSGLGMTGPSYRNWYDAGFMDILVNGQSLDSATPEFTRLTDLSLLGGEVLQGTWQTAEGPLRVTFSLCQGGLMLSATLDSEKPAKLSVRLFCIPGAGWGGWEDMDKYVVTAAGETPHGTPLTLRLEDDWLFHADGAYDLPHENAEGPCAALFLTPPTQVRCDNGNYVVQTDADYPEGTKDLSLILWDFHGQKNADALAAMEGLVARAKGR